MNVDDPTIMKLKRRLQYAAQEFMEAQAFHEAWRPAAYDQELHARMGESFASNTFTVIRLALRREMLMALMRLWDFNSGPSLVKIAKNLQDKRVVKALHDRCYADFAGDYHDLSENREEDRVQMEEFWKKHDHEHALERCANLIQSKDEIISIIHRYCPGGEDYDIFQYLKQIRDKRLAHLDIDQAVEASSSNVNNQKIEDFYQNIATVIHLLRLVVERVDYRPEETAILYGRHSKLFWEGARGERTEGHPSYRSSRVSTHTGEN